MDQLGEAQHSEFEFDWLTDTPTDEESDYSIGDISVISDCESNDDTMLMLTIRVRMLQRLMCSKLDKMVWMR